MSETASGKSDYNPRGEAPGGSVTARVTARVKEEVQKMMAEMLRGELLPSYGQIAARLNCSVTPVRVAMGELRDEGKISLQRGRPAKVLWNNSFSGSAQRAGSTTATTIVEASYRPLQERERAVAAEFELPEGAECIVCFRVRHVDGRPLAYQKTYINPLFFEEPRRFFLDHDVVKGSLSDVYGNAGLRTLRVSATLRVGEADELEQNLLELLSGSPVLRSAQRTMVEHSSGAKILEVMHATYTRDIEYAVERLPARKSGTPRESA
jgi:GntR family transcriptional regulator